MGNEKIMKRKSVWSDLAYMRYVERYAPLDIMRDELNIGIEKQEFRIDEGYDRNYNTNKYKTIFPLRDKFATVEKAETHSEIIVLTFWESSTREIELWRKKK